MFGRMAKDNFPSLPEVPKALAETPAGVDAPPRPRHPPSQVVDSVGEIICPARPTRPHCLIFVC